jgi:hypothetical protein
MMNLKSMEGRSHDLFKTLCILSEGTKENLICSTETDSVPTKVQTPELKVLQLIGHAEDDSHHTVNTSLVFKHHTNCVTYTVQHTCDVWCYVL